MAIAFGAHIGNNATFDPGTAVTSRTFTTTGAVPSGGHIIVGAVWYADGNAATGTISGGGLTWTTDHYATPDGDVNFSLGLFSAPAPSGLASSTVLTLTLTGLSYGVNLGGIYATGIATSSWEDVSSAADHTATSTWGSALTTTNADDLLIGLGYAEAETSSTANTGASYAEAFDFSHATTGNTLTMVYRIVSAASTYTPGGTWAVTPGVNLSASTSYKADAGGGGGGVGTPRPIQIIRSNIRLGP